MKSKKTIYFLIPLVALIWGLVIWKVFEFKPSPNTEFVAYHPKEKAEVADTIPYEILADYRDPFLRGSNSQASVKKTESKKSANNIKTVKVNSVLGVSKPDGLVYRGLIQGRYDRVGLLELGSTRMLVEEDSMVEGYKILSVEPDTLRISYQKKVFAYGKQ